MSTVKGIMAIFMVAYTGSGFSESFLPPESSKGSTQIPWQILKRGRGRPKDRNRGVYNRSGYRGR